MSVMETGIILKKGDKFLYVYLVILWKLSCGVIFLKQ